MRSATLTLLFASLSALTIASPLAGAEERDSDATLASRSLGDHGSYTISGLGSRKKQLSACGAGYLDLGIAMLETERMTTDYTYGDGKTGDAANFGVFKQNWGMLRQSVARYKGKTANDWNTGAELNSNLCLDIQLRQESQNHFGESLWMAGHRNGATGLSNPNTQDIQNYKDGVYWIRDQISANNGAGATNDIRYWVNVPAI